VAEIGGNALGQAGLAERLVRAAAQAQAGAVKFQAYRAELLAHPLNPAYRELSEEETDFGLLERLLHLAAGLGLQRGLSVFGPEGLDLAVRAKADFLKISSGDINHLPLIREAARLPLPLVISTGASTQGEVEAAINAVKGIRGGPGPEAVLQCASLYPAPERAINLGVMQAWLERGVPAGLSDHSLGLSASLTALSLGAHQVERHFTVDRALPGGDNSLSIGPRHMSCLALAAKEFSRLSAGGRFPRPSPGERRALQALPFWGRSEKGPAPGENPGLIRRKAVAGREIRAGERIRPGDIAYLRLGTEEWPPGNAAPVSAGPLLGPERELTGREAAARNLERHCPIRAEDLYIPG
jgi:sialic acid synthase SpsE